MISIKKRFPLQVMTRSLVKIQAVLLCVLFVLMVSCKSTDLPLRMELPVYLQHGEVVHHANYSLQYSETHEQAIWVAYQLTSAELEKNVSRSSSFRIDPLVDTKSANSADYAKSGYDRGHLAPSRDMAFDSVAQMESFYYSNVCPQVPKFNRGIWKKLESEVRVWAETYDTLYIVTGPVLRDELPAIGENQVSVPEYFYKAILIHTTTTKAAIGFVIPNSENTGNNFWDYAVTIDSIEEYAGLNFFSLLPDKEEDEIEKNLNLNVFSLTNSE
jgi:endonuclease G